MFRNWDDNRRFLHEVYDGGARYADEWVGAIVRHLQERNLMDSTLIIVTSDHGEALGDRWMPRPANHGHTLYDELLLVPLIFHLPKQIPSGRKVEKQVRLLDMLPTVLDLLGYRQPAFT
ncbi:MAG: sulfatase-like hydrolase/transferase, partial [Candidatus Hinthialibacter sp.]